MKGKSSSTWMLNRLRDGNIRPLYCQRIISQDIVNGGIIKSPRIQFDSKRCNVLSFIHEIMKSRSKTQEAMCSNKKPFGKMPVKWEFETWFNGFGSLRMSREKLVYNYTFKIALSKSIYISLQYWPYIK